MSSYLDEVINEVITLLEEGYQQEDWDMVEEAVTLLSAQNIAPSRFDDFYNEDS